MKNEWIIHVIILIVMTVLVTLIVVFIVNHPFISGLLCGLVVGVGGTLIVRDWLKKHRIVKIEPPEE